jgi:hypothetical protein
MAECSKRVRRIHFMVEREGFLRAIGTAAFIADFVSVPT